MKETFVINWVDPIANAVSVTYSTLPRTPYSVPVDKTNPDSWAQAISDFYRTIAPAVPVEAPIGLEMALVPVQAAVQEI